MIENIRRVMKLRIGRYLSLCLSFLLLAGLFMPCDALAAGTLPLIVSVSPTNAGMGDTVDITVSLGDCAGVDLGALQFDLVLPSRLRYQSYVLSTEAQKAIGAQLIAFNPANLRYAFAGTTTGYNGVSPLPLLTISCKVESSDAVPIGLSEVYACTVDAQNITTFVTQVTINASQPSSDNNSQANDPSKEQTNDHSDIDGADTAAPTEQEPVIHGGGIIPFDDVEQTAWYYDSVVYVYTNGLFTGTGSNKFSPNTSMSRAMIATVLYRLAGSPEVENEDGFSDVESGQWYAKAAAWAKKNGIVSGIGNNNFNPNGDITRQDLAVILYRYTQLINVSLTKTTEFLSFADDGNISSYAKEALYAMQEAGIVSGKPGNMADPQGKATRAEVAAMLHRLFGE